MGLSEMGSSTLLLAVCLLSLSVSLAVAQRECLVTEKGSQREDVACQFPFVFKGVTYDRCTDETDPGKLWCSTRTKDDGSNEHVGGGGYWGYCPDSCQEEEEEEDDNGGGGEDIDNEIDEALDSLEESGLRSSGFQSCPCTTYRECPVVKRLVEIGEKLPRGHSRRTRILNALRRVVCQRRSSQGDRLFHCCSSPPPPKSPSPSPPTGRPTPVTQRTVPKEPTNQEEAGHDDVNLGTWKPDPEFGQCGTNPNTGKVIGGERAKLAEFPFMVLLGYLYPSGRVYYTCGAALINRHYVLTAAHCVTGEYEVHELVFGEHDLGSRFRDCDDKGCLPPVQRRAPAEITVHDDWDLRRFQDGNDIALIRLDRPVDTLIEDPTNTDNTILVPVCLPWRPDQPVRQLGAGDVATVAGWGKITNSRSATRINYEQFSGASRYLNKLALPLKSEPECVEDFPRYNARTQLCAGGRREQDSCNGDSGGPLFLKDPENDPNGRFFQVGVVSYGTRNCGRGKPGIYTKVAAYLDWIERNLKP